MLNNIIKEPTTHALCNSLTRSTIKYIGAMLLFGSLIVVGKMFFENFDGIGSRLAGLFLFVSLFLIINLDSNIKSRVRKNEYRLMLVSSSQKKFESIFVRAACLFVLNEKSVVHHFFKKTKKVNVAILALGKAALKTVAVTLTPKILPAPEAPRA